MATNDITEAEVFGPVGYLSVCLAHIRTGHPIEDVEYGCIAATPTQAEVDQARLMAAALTNGWHDGGQDDEQHDH